MKKTWFGLVLIILSVVLIAFSIYLASNTLKMVAEDATNYQFNVASLFFIGVGVIMAVFAAFILIFAFVAFFKKKQGAYLAVFIITCATMLPFGLILLASGILESTLTEMMPQYGMDGYYNYVDLAPFQTMSVVLAIGVIAYAVFGLVAFLRQKKINSGY